MLQHNITAKRTKEAGLVLIVIPTTKREKLAEKAKPVFENPSKTQNIGVKNSKSSMDIQD